MKYPAIPNINFYVMNLVFFSWQINNNFMGGLPLV